MRLLFVLPSVPFPPADGGKAKVYNLLKYIASRHECDLVCLGELSVDAELKFRSEIPAIGTVTTIPYPSHLRQIASLCWHLLNLRPASLARFSSARIAQLLATADRSGRYDVIHYDIVNMAQYLRGGQVTATVHSPNDATSLVYARMAAASSNAVARLKLRGSAYLLQRFERRYYPRFSKVHVVSEADKRYLRVVAAGCEICVIPISSGYPHSLQLEQHSIRPSGTQRVVAICGNLISPAIAQGVVEFCEEVLPKLVQAYPELRVRILSRSMPVAVVERIKRCRNVETTTWVCGFEAFLSEADVVLIPDKAGAAGAKTRVVQAMALGKAVLGSPTAMEDIPVRDGQHGFVYTSPEQCVEIVLQLLGDDMLRGSVGRAAAGLAAEEYSLDRVGPRYEALYLAAKERAEVLAKCKLEQTSQAGEI